ncbi:MAG: hypothetical protein WCQ57_12625 [Verrucomicrobiota bacterium]
MDTLPNCHGCRFNGDSDAAIAHAKVLSSRPQTSVTAADPQ